MKVCLEHYRAFIIVGLLTVAVFVITGLSNYLFYALLPFATFSALLALSNIKNGRIAMYWKKENKTIFIPFQHGRGSIFAYDEEANEYKMNIFLFPKRINRNSQ